MPIRKFSLDEDFDKYVEKMEETFCAKNMNDDKQKINFFLKSAGDELEQVLKATVSEKALVEMNFNQIIKVLSKYFKKKRNVRAERYTFYTRKLRPNEELKDFIKTIKYLASACDFGNFTDSMLCDKLIMAQKDVEMRKKLIEEPITTKFDQMCKIALGEQVTNGYQVVETISKDFEKMKLIENKVQEKRNIQFEEILKRINQFVTLEPVDRCQYKKDYDNIKNYIKDECKRVCPTFRMLFKGDVLSGSCADNLKIIKPNEFDLIFQLELPLMKHVRRRKCSEKPGFLKINIAKMLEEISKIKDYDAVYIKLLRLVDKNKFIVQQKVSSWMEGIMTEIIPKDGQIKVPENQNGIEKCYKVHYTKCGPAHTLRVIQENEFSIDFVPGFVFDYPIWLAQRPYPKDIAKKTNWHAVPKPDKTNLDKEPNIYFITSYISIESAFIENKQKLKNALRLLKKIRNNSNIELLKSYFIKTVFLWETTKQTDEFWTKNSLEHVFIHMFDVLVQYVQGRKLPSFWDEDFDMFQKFTSDQMTSMCGQLTSVHKSVKKLISSSGSDQLYKVFLTKEEMEELLKKV